MAARRPFGLWLLLPALCLSVLTASARLNTPPTITDIPDQTILADTSTGPLLFTIDDAETAPDQLLLSKGSSDTQLVPLANIVISGRGNRRSVDVTPVKGGTGRVQITITVTDAGQLQARDSFIVNIIPNTPPTISDIPDQKIQEDSNTGPVPFTVSDKETPAASLTLSGSSDNQLLIPDANIVFGGSDTKRTVTVTPAPNQSGQALIVVTVSDGALTAVDRFIVNVSPVNDPPTISDVPDQVINEDSSTGPLSFTVADIDNNIEDLKVTGNSDNLTLVPLNGILISGTGGDRTVTVTPAANQFGSAVITLTVDDGSATASDKFILRVNPVNDGPTISDIPDQAVLEDTSTGPIDFTVGDIDTPLDQLTFTVDSDNPNLAPLNNISIGGSGANRTVTVVPAGNQSGAALITVKVSDGSLSAADTFRLSVRPVNDAPSISEIADQSISEDGTTGPLTFTIGDPETPADQLTLSVNSDNLALIPLNNIVLGGNGANRTIQVTPVANQSGSALITVTVSDGSLSSSEPFAVVVNPVNDGPSISDIPDQTINEDSTTGPIPFTIGDLETPPDQLILSVNSDNVALVPLNGILIGLNGANRTVQVTPAPNQFGSAVITVTVSDGSLSASDNFTVTVNPVNDGPSISDIPNQSINEDSSTGPIPFTIGDPETPPDQLILSVNSDNVALVPLNGILIGLNGANRTVQVTPAPNQFGSAVITVTVSDGSLSASDNFTVTVNPVNDPPTISDISNQVINEDASTGPVGFTIGDVETPPDQLQVSASSDNPNLAGPGNIVLGGSGANRTITITPIANQSGVATITVTVSDGSASASDQFILTVTAGNDLPTISDIPNQVINEDTSTGPIAFTVGDAETPADQLQVTVQSDNPGLAGPANIILGGSGPNRTVTVTPVANQSGVANITVRVSDGEFSNSDQFTLTVNPVNDLPFISEIANQTINEDAATGPIGFTIGDVETPPDQLQITFSSSNPVLLPQAGIVLGGGGANRTVTLTPAGNQFGAATITINVSDGAASATAQFVLTVNPVNDAPFISDIPDQGITAGGSSGPIAFTIGDVDNDVSTLVLSATSSDPSVVPLSGIVFGGSGANRTVTITPAANQSGKSTIVVTVSDGNLTASDSFVVTVSAVVQPPKIVQQPASLTVAPGDRALFNVTVTGTTPFEFQWFFNGQPIAGAKAASFAIESVQASDAGNYQVTVKNSAGSDTSTVATLTLLARDFGDAPAPYPTLLKDNGAFHAIRELRLGNFIDGEKDGQPNANASLDDVTPEVPDDEDGVTFPNPLIIGQLTSIQVTAPFGGRLDAWIDFNGDGSWAGSGEQIFVSQALNPGLNSLFVNVPSTAKAGVTFARFRLSSQGGLSFTGGAPDGEVEDYQVTLVQRTEEQLDFGDAPDPTYPTILKNNGARHVIQKGLSLGREIDAEKDGQPNATATGDDLAPAGSPNDEDGVVFITPLTPGSLATVLVTVQGEGFLNAWIDFNANGSWADANEQIITGLPVGPGDHTIDFQVPTDAKSGPTFARFRLSLERQLSFLGFGGPGEVEDYQVTVGGELLDFGDAPQTENGGFPTTLSRNGARHQILKGFHLGRIEDGEADGQPNATATGDDVAGTPNDEDGVRFLGLLVPGTSVQVEITTTAGGRIDAWVDFNRNLSWTDPGERIFTSQAVAAGVNVFNVAVPANAVPGDAFARFRLSREGRLNFDGPGGVGEVEDYSVAIVRRPDQCDLGCGGREFWLTFPGNYAPNPLNPVRPKLLIVGTPGTVVTVNVPGLTPAFTVNVPIPAPGSVEVNLPPGVDLGDANDVIEKKGIHVTATAPVSVNGLSKVEFTSDGYLALPLDVLGTNHYVLAYGNSFTGMPEMNNSQFAIVATENDTTVSITPSVVTGVRDSHIAYLIKLQAGQTYQLRTTEGFPSDLTGTQVDSDKPIALFGSHGCANVNSGSKAFCDYMVEQLPPVNRWATEFYARRLVPRAKGDTFRVLAAETNTVVSINGSTVATINAGEFYQTLQPAFPGINAIQITATHPVLVAQYANSSDFDGVVVSDPFMALVPGPGLFSAQHRFHVPLLGFAVHHINVIVPTAAAGTVTLDALPMGGFSPIGLTGFSHGTAFVSPGLHTLTASQPVGLTIYGWNKYEGYGWPGCLSFGDTTPPTITCPPGTTVTLGANVTGAKPCQAPVPDFRAQATAQDNCPRSDFTTGQGGGGISQDPPPGTLVGPGVHIIHLSVADAHGNIGRCDTTFTVIDPSPDPNAKPVMHCPEVINVQCSDPAGAIVNYNAFATVGCAEFPVDCSPPSGSLFPPGTTQVICTFDHPGNPQFCTFNVNVFCQSQNPIVITTTPGQVTIDWTPTQILEQAPTILGPWTVVVGATPPFTIETSNTQFFFRVRTPP